MEGKILCFYKAVAYLTILWAACQPQPAAQEFSWRVGDNYPFCENNEVATARLEGKRSVD
ncbi:hypothetical protein [Methylocystis parvus]|uniref:Uncharacterized protein n=1 Tax=Methylocystis parvus TaxID=134 RepID=A0A6B8M1E8_9HYPH|nr:hypothetical protein [Methylocystis parvus]QGM96076.1 hypothetical protein F7D14_00230 [Methylocystis parvus]WBK00104.1 hypothetical protein MMG94_19385 [Methylocystis parvus OBBP]